MTIYSIIVAIDNNNAIGRGNQMLTHLPDDLKYFKKVTSGHSVIMGRKTFESLPKGALPNRRNIVITRDKNITFPNCEMVHSLDEATKAVEGEEEVFIMGGGEIYKAMIEKADKLYITHIQNSFPHAEVYFPTIEPSKWEKVWEEHHTKDEKHEYEFNFVQYTRK